MKSIKARHHSSYVSFTVLSILLPIVGFVLGIVYLTKSDELDRKVGEHLLATSVLVVVVQFILLFLLLLV